jgi:hypothetical protein
MAERSVKAVAKRIAAPVVEVIEEPEVEAEPATPESGARSWQQGGLPSRNRMNERLMRDVTCRSCGKRPGRPTAIIGQLTATELCEVCANLRKERIRANRASQRGYRL